jgi:outer membrane protein assembly factor BamB
MLISTVAVGLLVAAPSARAQEWTRFRGPNGEGMGKGESIPVQWTEKEYNWKVKLPGTGYGSPVVWGEKVFVLCAEEKTGMRRVVCLSAANGGGVWTREYPCEPYAHHTDNSLAASTPAVDKDRLYVCWVSLKSILLVAMDHDGTEIWRRDLGPHKSQHGPCITPIVHEDMVIVPNDQDGPSFVLAVEAATGKTRWQQPRKSGRAAYGTPCLRRIEGRPAEIVLASTADGVTGLDAATGQVAWQINGVFPERCVGSPALAGDLVVGACGTGGSGVRMVAVRPAGDKKAELAYDLRKDPPYVPTPLVKGELMFLLGDTGLVTCLQAATGRQVWQSRISDRFYGSFVCVGDRLYCISRTGNVHVLAAGEKYELLATNALGEKSFSTPAVAGGKMYLRTFSYLISIGGKQAEGGRQ